MYVGHINLDRSMNGNGEHSAQPREAADSVSERLHLADRLALRPVVWVRRA